MFGSDIDPVAEAVGEALRAFKPSQRDLGYVERTAFNDRLNRMIARITQIQKSLKNGDFGNL